jgi:hypothetical protein
MTVSLQGAKKVYAMVTIPHFVNGKCVTATTGINS